MSCQHHKGRAADPAREQDQETVPAAPVRKPAGLPVGKTGLVARADLLAAAAEDLAPAGSSDPASSPQQTPTRTAR
jgi:hypothetical protein